VEPWAAYFGVKSLLPAGPAPEQFHISVKLSPAAHLVFGTLSQLKLEYSLSHPCLPPGDQLLSFHEEIVLLEDVTSLSIFSFFLLGRNLMGKQTFSGCAV